MEIKTKYNLCDSVWTMKDNRVHNIIIESISTRSQMVPTGLNYGVELQQSITYTDTHGEVYFENELFPTKEELIASL